MTKPRRNRVLTFLASCGCGALAWLCLAEPARQPLQRVRVTGQAAEPGATPQSLDQLLRSPRLDELGARLEAAREAMGAGVAATAAPAPASLTREEFENRFPRSPGTKILGLIRAPQLARADRLARDPALNPHDLMLPAGEIALLERVIDSHRAVIDVVKQARDHEVHRLGLEVARADGVIPLRAARERLSPETRKELVARASHRHSPGTPEHARALRMLELLAANRAIGADSSLLLGGKPYLVPKDTVLPQVAAYDDYLHMAALAMVSDVLAVFLRNGALTSDEVGSLLATLEHAATHRPHSD